MARPAFTADDLIARLSARHRPPEWAFFQQVPSSTGGAGSRTADAVAMNLWPSRGLEVHGFEVKISRNDWLRELKAPAKADEIAGYCDRFWLVVADATIVHPGELPATWGLLGPRGDGLVTVKDAAKLDSRPLDRGFVAAILRKATDGFVPAADVEDRIAKARAQFEAAHQNRMESYEEDAKELRETIAEFEKRSGLSLNTYRVGNIADAVNALVSGNAAAMVRDMDVVRNHAARAVEEMDGQLAAVRAALPVAARTGTEG
jgi:hypothetical protein